MPGLLIDITRVCHEHPFPAEHPLGAIAVWAGHVAAGRIGTASAPPPPPPAIHADGRHDYGCASLTAILRATSSARQRA